MDVCMFNIHINTHTHIYIYMYTHISVTGNRDDSSGKPCTSYPTSCQNRDLRGCTAAHCVPLLAAVAPGSILPGLHVSCVRQLWHEQSKELKQLLFRALLQQNVIGIRPSCNETRCFFRSRLAARIRPRRIWRRPPDVVELRFGGYLLIFNSYLVSIPLKFSSVCREGLQDKGWG